MQIQACSNATTTQKANKQAHTKQQRQRLDERRPLVCIPRNPSLFHETTRLYSTKPKCLLLRLFVCYNSNIDSSCLQCLCHPTQCLFLPPQSGLSLPPIPCLLDSNAQFKTCHCWGGKVGFWLSPCCFSMCLMRRRKSWHQPSL